MYISIILTTNLSYKGVKYPEGQSIKIETDDFGVPLDSFWRRRLKDSKIDNCFKITNKKKGK